jgi:hypothetical protein
MIDEVIEMRDINDRPTCHRADDLVTYLYGEAAEADAVDFRTHLQVCDACRTEFTMFNQVHDSIAVWRDEVIGTTFVSAGAVSTEQANVPELQTKRLSALAAIRQFFAVSPLWLRGATAFAALLLCVLAIFAVSRWSQRPVQVASLSPELKYTRQDLDKAVQKGIDAKLAELQNQTNTTTTVTVNSNSQPRTEPAVYKTQPKKVRNKGLTLQERQQLAADLRLVPDDDDLPFGISSEEPEQ